MTKRYNHAITLAIAVDSDDPEMPTLDEAMAALRARVAQLEVNRDEADEALRSEAPLDSYEREDTDNDRDR